MKKIYLIIICLVSVLLALSTCHFGYHPAGQNSVQAGTDEDQAAITDQEFYADMLSDEELQAFTVLFDTPEYNGFLEEPFNSHADINWDTVLHNGAGLTLQKVSEMEIRDFLDATGQKKLYGDLFVIRKSDLADYIRKHSGSDLSPEEVVLSWDYIEKYGSYYLQHWANEQIAYTCISGEKRGDHYTLRFELSADRSAGTDPRRHSGTFADRILTLTKSGDYFVMESNTIQWDDHCDKDLTFNVKLSQFDTPVRFITYSGAADHISILLVKDGKRLTELSTYIMTDTLGYLKTINAAGFFDFNADGMEDIAIIGDSDYGRHVLLHEAVTNDYIFEYFADLDEKKMAEIGADFTVDEIQTALIGEHQESTYNSWQELYEQIAKVYHIADDGYRYDLIYADDDEIPELLIDYPGFRISLFTYENGYAHCLMHQWPYGAAGNSGYSVVPGMGIYYNGNADYAGAIYYDSYLSARDTGEIDIDFWVKHINFNDLDGDGEPSEDELAASREYTGFSEYHNETDREMTSDEIKAVIELYDSYETKYLSGVNDYESLLTQLKRMQ